ncbi:MAG: DNA modification methylase [Alphaproteobacteria bacterium]|nr:DNA modification methylase [Alphaproteobacteria bacterium]
MEIWQVKNIKVKDLIPNAKNPRKISKAKLEELKSKIERLGFHNPVKVDEEMNLLGGNQRVKALLQMGAGELEIPVMIPNRPLTKKEKDEIIITDNISDGEWDFDILKEEWDTKELKDWGLEWDFDDTEDEEVEIIEDEIPEEVKTRCNPGEIWQLGEHRLLCGDTTLKENVQTLMNGEIANMIFTDPPYNVNYGCNLKDKIRNKDRTIMNDNLGDGFKQFLTDSLTNLLEYSDGAAYVCMSSSELHTLYNAFIDASGKWSTFIIWAKNTFTLGRSDYQRQFEPILYGWKAKGKHYWCGDRDQSDVWEYNKPLKNDLHPTMPPVELVAKAVQNSSKPGDIVIDGFGGSGTTLIACEQLGRKCRMIELDTHYCDVILQRWENLTGQKAKKL